MRRGRVFATEGTEMSKALAELTVDRGREHLTIELEDSLLWHADAEHEHLTGYLNEVCRIDPEVAHRSLGLRHRLFQCAHRLGATVRIHEPSSL